jgi:CheY-like chemotaxis protein
MAVTSPACILVVDDDADSRETLREVLEELGHRVVEAANGREALDFLVDHPTEGVKLILLDLQMPIMNGWQLLKLLDSYVRLSSIPVLVISAFASTLESDAYRSLVGQLEVPYKLPQLRAMVQAVASPSNLPS